MPQALSELEARYDGAIPAAALDAARYGSPEMARLVWLQHYVIAWRQQVRFGLRVVRLRRRDLSLQPHMLGDLRMAIKAYRDAQTMLALATIAYATSTDGREAMRQACAERVKRGGPRAADFAKALSAELDARGI